MKLTERSFARRIDLTSLQLFVAVCEAGSIGKAADREFIAASAVSKRLADLEAALGTPLLYRHARGVDLTPAGQSLLHHARNVLYGLEKMQSELGEYADGVRGHVRVHASISAIVQFLPDDLGSFVRAHPQVKIDLEEHLSGDVVRAVQEGAADLGICNASALSAGGTTLQTLPYRQDDLVLVVPAARGALVRPLRAQARPAGDRPAPAQAQARWRSRGRSGGCRAAPSRLSGARRAAHRRRASAQRRARASRPRPGRCRSCGTWHPAR